MGLNNITREYKYVFIQSVENKKILLLGLQ